MAAMTSKTAKALDVQALRADFPILSRMVNGKAAGLSRQRGHDTEASFRHTVAGRLL